MSVSTEESPLLAHLAELRTRLFWSALAWLVGFGICVFWYDPFLAILSAPLSKISQAGPFQLYMSNITEGFNTRIKISAIVGLIISSPFHIFSILGFILPALTRKEKIWLLSGCFSSFLLVLLSVYITYFNLLPMSIGFLTDRSMVPATVGVLFDYHDNMMLIIQLIGYSLLIFQTPILLEVLLAMNVISRKTLWKNSRFVVVIIFILAAIVTPPDFISQLTIALPLIVLYFITILIAKLFRFGEDYQ